LAMDHACDCCKKMQRFKLSRWTITGRRGTFPPTILRSAPYRIFSIQVMGKNRPEFTS
jgi:hypothetical protein